MAWTAPRTWTVGELVTAAYLNTHIRDNLSYLKGDTTDIQIGTTGQKWGLGIAPTRQHHIYGAGQATAALTDAGNAGGTAYLQDSGTNAGNGGALIFGAGQGLHAGIKSLLTNGAGQTTGDLAFSTRNATSDTALTERMRLTAAGRLGINRSSPQGALHGLQTLGGFLYWEFDGVDATTRTALPAGSVAYSATFLYNTRSSAGTPVINGSVGNKALGASLVINTDGGTNTCTLTVNADGSVSVVRTAGTVTYKVQLWIIYM